MSTRICVYKDCHNFYSRVDNTACSDVTLFAFPKDAKRAALWRLLGQVHPKIGAKQLFMCSQHFESKYLSVTKHRTTLVGEALPIAYDEKEVKPSDEEKSASQENLYIKSNENGNVEICSREKTTTKTSSLNPPQSFYINLDDDQLTLDNVVLLQSKPHPQQIASPPRKRPRSPSPAPPSPVEQNPDDDGDDQLLLDASEVQTFVVQGKHYVKMTRQFYVQEKLQMLQQLQQYKEILSNIKQQVKPLEDL